MKLVSILNINMYIRMYKYWTTTKMRPIVGCDEKMTEPLYQRIKNWPVKKEENMYFKLHRK